MVAILVLTELSLQSSIQQLVQRGSMKELWKCFDSSKDPTYTLIFLFICLFIQQTIVLFKGTKPEASKTRATVRECNLNIFSHLFRMTKLAGVFSFLFFFSLKETLKLSKVACFSRVYNTGKQIKYAWGITLRVVAQCFVFTEGFTEGAMHSMREKTQAQDIKVVRKV